LITKLYKVPPSGPAIIIIVETSTVCFPDTWNGRAEKKKTEKNDEKVKKSQKCEIPKMAI
jgi:hypothetical protein